MLFLLLAHAVVRETPDSAFGFAHARLRAAPFAWPEQIRGWMPHFIRAGRCAPLADEHRDALALALAAVNDPQVEEALAKLQACAFEDLVAVDFALDLDQFQEAVLEVQGQVIRAETEFPDYASSFCALTATARRAKRLSVGLLDLVAAGGACPSPAMDGLLAALTVLGAHGEDVAAQPVVAECTSLPERFNNKLRGLAWPSEAQLEASSTAALRMLGGVGAYLPRGWLPDAVYETRNSQAAVQRVVHQLHRAGRVLREERGADLLTKALPFQNLPQQFGAAHQELVKACAAAAEAAGVDAFGTTSVPQQPLCQWQEPDPARTHRSPVPVVAGVPFAELEHLEAVAANLRVLKNAAEQCSFPMSVAAYALATCEKPEARVVQLNLPRLAGALARLDAEELEASGMLFTSDGKLFARHSEEYEAWLEVADLVGPAAALVDQVHAELPRPTMDFTKLLTSAHRYVKLPKAFAKASSTLMLACIDYVMEAGLDANACREKKQRVAALEALMSALQLLSMDMRPCLPSWRLAVDDAVGTVARAGGAVVRTAQDSRVQRAAAAAAALGGLAAMALTSLAGRSAVEVLESGVNMTGS